MVDETDRTTQETTPNPAVHGFQVVSEVCLLIGIVVGLELTTGDSKVGAFGFHPHPYWLVILPMAAGRGLFGGLVAATLASALYLLGAREALGLVSLNGFMDFDVMRDPILFYTVSFVVGELHDIVVERMRRLQASLSESEEDRLRVRGQRNVLTEANRVLERRIVDQHGNFATLIDIVSRTEDATRAEVFDIALELVEEQCGATASVLIPHVDGRVEPFRAQAGGEEVAIPASNASESVRRAILEGREINSFAVDEPPPESGPLVVSPLFGASGVIEALLCLEEVPVSILNNTTIRSFQSIGRWASAILARLERDHGREESVDRVDYSEPSPEWLGTPQEFLARLHREYERMARYGMPLSFLGLRVGGEGEESPRVGAVDEFVIERFATRVRASDAVYRFPHPGCYLLVLPATPREGADAVYRRLVSEASREWQSPGEIHVHVTAPGPATSDPESLLRELVAEFRRSGPMLFEKEMPMELGYQPALGSLATFRRVLSEELALAMRNEYPLQVLSIRSADTGHADPGVMGEVVTELLSSALRRVDTASAIGENHVAVILPMTTEEAGEKVASRVRKALNDPSAGHSFREVIVDVLGFGPRHPYFGAFIRSLSRDRPVAEVRSIGGER